MNWVLLIATFLAAHAEPTLRVRPHIVVAPGSQVMMAQLVDGQGLSATLNAKLQTLAVTQAPAYGEKQEMANANLMSILRPLIQAERQGGSLQLIVPKVVTIDTSKRGLEADMVQNEMLQAWQPRCGDCQLEIEGLSLPRIDGIRDWTLRLRNELPRGSFSVPVELVRENGAPTTAWISGRLLIKRKVPVANREIAIGERVSAKDFGWEYRDTSFSTDGIPTSEDLVGRRLKQGLKVTDVLWKAMLERERAIRAGELVQLKSSSAQWEVSMNVIAQQDAYIGDVINLKNPKTNNILVGEVVAQGEAVLR